VKKLRNKKPFGREKEWSTACHWRLPRSEAAIGVFLACRAFKGIDIEGESINGSKI